ncbi:CMP-N-acetylneuraminate-beta-galactosamide-alpha-2, 3-sialyltransferase [Moraxella macacae 0408225]|uniref:CMP-N-acetylneuraminate-beta-galactosamide-alpha-2, 3-sialyltransferase n=1 Tax=Moraxella macacae 0408225 TaxID=1230338 RepID=L2F6G8_9GAMM|nr:glycosyltransferase family 52 [Moraxella macacae]ELA08391.1 CMP-N-acetylneuraminate-beta-galactosamide-alpha-2, 3-sialyltransferase [Moraxella macacae 0408225]
MKPNLIICMTPLQVLIARKIIERHSQDFIGIYLAETDNAKHRFYSQKLAQQCLRHAYISLNTDKSATKWQKSLAKLQQFTTVKQQLMRLNIWQQPISTVFLANMDLIIPQYILAKVNYKTLNTFDDGTMNIFPTSRYFLPKKQPFAKWLFKKMLGIQADDLNKILAKTQQHYTIFPDKTNIVANPIPINLFSKTYQNLKTVTATTRILLGQPFDDIIGEQAYQTMINQTIKDYQINYFYPHPRENSRFDDTLPVIKTQSIIEDYLINQLEQQSNTVFEIYTFTSTAIFSLQALPRVKVFAILHEFLQADFAQNYEFLQTQGIQILPEQNHD